MQIDKQTPINKNIDDLSYNFALFLEEKLEKISKLSFLLLSSLWLLRPFNFSYRIETFP